MNRTKTRIAALLLAAACYPIIGGAIAQAQALPSTRAFRLEHSDPTASAEMLRQLYPQVLTVVEAAEKSLIVRGSDQILDEVEAVLKAIDVPRSKNATPKAATDPKVASLKGATGSGVRVDLSRSVGPSSPDSILSKLQDDYRSHEQQAQQLASQTRGAAQRQQPVQDAIGMEGAAVGGWAKDLPSPQVTPQLREQVTKAFDARQQLLRLELEQFRQRLARIEQTLEARERLKQTIIDQRIKELLNPALEWEPATSNHPRKAEPVTLSAPPAMAPGVSVQIPALGTGPLTMEPVPTAPERPMRQVVMLQERVNRAMDELAVGKGTIDKVIPLIKELHEAETLGKRPNAWHALEHLARLQKLKQIAVDAAKRGSLPAAAKLTEVEKALQEAIEQAGYQSQEAFPRVRMTPRSFRKERLRADQALRRTQDQVDSLTKTNPGTSERGLRQRFPEVWQELESAQAQQRAIASQIDGVNLTIRLLNLRLERLRAEGANADSSERDKQIAEAQRGLKRLERVAELYRQAMAPPEKWTLPLVVEGTDVENEAVVEEHLWNYIGVELRQYGDGVGTGNGLMVTGVRDNSPAQKAGIRFRDFVQAVDGFGTLSAADVWDVFVETSPSQQVTFHILRDNQGHAIKVDLTNADNAVGLSKPAEFPATAKPSSLVPPSGAAQPSNNALPRQFGGQRSQLVTSMRQRYQDTLDELAKFETTVSEAARVADELDKAELNAAPNSATVLEASLDRWQRLRQLAEERYKNGMLGPHQLQDVDRGLERPNGDWASEARHLLATTA